MEEVKLQPGWLRRDVDRAAERVKRFALLQPKKPATEFDREKSTQKV